MIIEDPHEEGDNGLSLLSFGKVTKREGNGDVIEPTHAICRIVPNIELFVVVRLVEQ